MDIALRFQEIVTSATSADYRQIDLFGKDDSLRLATAAVNRGQTFARAMAESGHEFHFRESEDIEEINELDFEHLVLDGEDTVPVRFVAEHLDIQDVVHFSSAITEPRDDDILAWLKSVYQRSRGFELGTFASSVLSVAMQQQARKWKDLALGYISDVATLVHMFIVKLLKHVVPNQHVQQALTSLLIDDLRKKYQTALDQTEFLTVVELEGPPATYNHYFNDTLDKW